MPFDVIDPFTDARVADEIDELAALGITPVPRKIVDAHKAKMLNLYKRVHARWNEYPLLRDRIETSLARLDIALGRLDKRSHLVGSAPASVIAIAKLVRDTVPDAEFEVGVFYNDPYLKVTYGEQHKEAYLGVWLDQKNLVAVAQRDGEGDPLTWWDRMKLRLRRVI